MKNFFITFLFIVIVLSGVFYSGCSLTSSDGGSSTIKGYIYDSATGMGVKWPTVTISTLNFAATITGDSAGNITILNLTQDTYTLSVKAYGYHTRTITGVVVPSDDTLRTSISVLFSNVYIYNSVDIEEYLFPTSNCALELDSGLYVPATNSLKDIQLMDTVVGISESTLKVVFRSSDLDSVNLGKETKFSPVFPGFYTKTMFDSLFYYYGFDPNNLTASYPNKTTDAIDINSVNTVYAVFLKGKSNNFLKPMFGLIRISDVGIRPWGQIYVTLNIKINKNGENNFNPNPAKK